MRNVLKYLFLFLIGGMAYYFLEIAWRGYSHWSMFIIGGFCFVLCGSMNDEFEWEMPIWKQMLICSVGITGIEFVCGCILNIGFGLNVWDYSNVPLNVLGQICLPYTFLWFLVSFVAIVLDDYLRYWFFKEEKPRYYWR